MKLTFEEVRAMNDIQLDIFRVFISVCNKLNLRYYMVHGSLLGAFTRGSFFPYDDDIDVAMPRRDYDILMEKGNECIPEGYFIQSCKTEKEFPLVFGKMRNNNTAFIQTALKDLNVNQGIYIDIFPIDYYPNKKIMELYIRAKEIIMSTRISTRLHYDNRQPIWKKISQLISVVLVPSWEKAVQERAQLFMKNKRTEKIIIVGGKPCERGIPEKWFTDIIEVSFEGISVSCPQYSDQYLNHIYGDYKSYNPVHEYLNEDGTLTVSAYAFDMGKSYREYRK